MRAQRKCRPSSPAAYVPNTPRPGQCGGCVGTKRGAFNREPEFQSGVCGREWRLAYDTAMERLIAHPDMPGQFPCKFMVRMIAVDDSDLISRHPSDSPFGAAQIKRAGSEKKQFGS